MAHLRKPSKIKKRSSACKVSTCVFLRGVESSLGSQNNGPMLGPLCISSGLDMVRSVFDMVLGFFKARVARV